MDISSQRSPIFILIASSTGAGIAAIANTPIVGLLFVAELIQKYTGQPYFVLGFSRSMGNEMDAPYWLTEYFVITVWRVATPCHKWRLHIFQHLSDYSNLLSPNAYQT